MLEYLDIAIGFTTVMLLLSLIVTAIVQAVSTVLDLRGNNLVWGLAKLFEQMPVTGLDKKVANEISLAVAKHPSIRQSNFNWFKAKAIRPDELQMIVHKLAEKPPADLSQAAKDALKQLVTERVPGAGDALEKAKDVSKELEALFPARGAEIRAAVQNVMGKSKRIEAEINTWFDTVMDRSADRFSRNSKVWAAAIGTVLAFALQVDAVSIFKQITNNAGVRSQLVAMAEPTLKQAAEIEQGENSAGKTLDELKQKENFKAAKLDQVPATLRTCSEAETWMNANLKPEGANADAQKSGAVQAFHQRCNELQVQALGTLPERFQKLKANVDSTNLVVFGRFEPAQKSDTKFWGWLLTAALLSLGAPFWFNALRELSSLRPPISQKISKEKEAGTAEKPAARAAAQGK